MKRVVLMFIPALICGVVFTSCGSNQAKPQKEKAVDEISEVSEWWQPILQKHKIEPVGYNNYDNVFIMGREGNSIKNGICTLKVATVLLKNSNKSYILYEADSVYHNIKEGFLEIMSGTLKVYDLDADLSKQSSVEHFNVALVHLSESHSE